MNKNFGLSEKQFNQMIEEMRLDNNVLFESIFLSHFKDCIAFLKQKYGANYNDAYDATMDTLLEFRLRIIDGKVRYGNVRYLFTKMATQVYMRNRKNYVARDVEEDDLKADDVQLNHDELHQLSQAWQELSDACQRLFKLHFYGNMKLSEIAKDDDRTPLSVRKQKIRCLNKLLTAYSKRNKSTINEEFLPII